LSKQDSIEVGDTVKVVATGKLAKTIGYMSAKDIFQLQFGNSPIPITFARRDELELVEKPATGGGPGFVPGSSIMG
jgi:hypothetical protein